MRFTQEDREWGIVACQILGWTAGGLILESLTISGAVERAIRLYLGLLLGP